MKRLLEKVSATRFFSLSGKALVGPFVYLLFRAPDTSKVKQKMLYASSKDAIRKKLVGIGAEIQGTDLSEVSYDAVLEKVRSI